MQTALDVYLAAGQHSLRAQRELLIASVVFGCTLWAEAVAPFYRTTADALGMYARIALPRLHPADVVQLGALRDAKAKRAERRAHALRG